MSDPNFSSSPQGPSSPPSGIETPEQTARRLAALNNPSPQVPMGVPAAQAPSDASAPQFTNSTDPSAGYSGAPYPGVANPGFSDGPTAQPTPVVPPAAPAAYSGPGMQSDYPQPGQVFPGQFPPGQFPQNQFVQPGQGVALYGAPYGNAAVGNAPFPNAPYGATPFGNPQYGTAPYGAPYGGVYPVGAARPWSRTAIISLIVGVAVLLISLFSSFMIVAALPIVCGVGGITDCTRRGRKGIALAIIGLICGVLSGVLFIVNTALSV